MCLLSQRHAWRPLFTRAFVCGAWLQSGWVKGFGCLLPILALSAVFLDQVNINAGCGLRLFPCAPLSLRLPFHVQLCESRLWRCVQAPAPNAWEGNTATVFGSDCQWMTSSRWVFHSLLKVLPTPHTYFCVLSLPSPVPFVEAVAVPLRVSAVPALYRAVAVCC